MWAAPQARSAHAIGIGKSTSARARCARWLAGVVVGTLLQVTGAMAADEGAQIVYQGTAPEGLVGNGRSVVKVRPGSYAFHTGGDGSGTLRLVVAGVSHELASPEIQSVFFPGGVAYVIEVAGATVEILHGAFADVPYFVAVRVRGARDPVELEVAGGGVPSLQPTGRVSVRLERGIGEVVLAAGSSPPAGSWAELRKRLEDPYREGLVLETPSALVDRAVPFCRYLLDLGFDGRMHVCEIFRWRDVWSRDLGSGLAPGAMASGRFAAARSTIAYDLARHAAADPRGLKVTHDPSQGGTAEGVAWLTRAVWRDYMLTGDLPALRRATHTLQPWVDAWIDRDPDESGLLVDVSEWMDHSRFFLFPDGARVLYSNVLFAELLNRFSTIESSLGDRAAAQYYGAVGERFVHGINAGLWNDAAGRYDNLSLWERRDERIASAENALAVVCGVAPLERARSALAAVRSNAWRSAGSTTIYPPMTHVPEYIDHNFKMWPWWNAVEARARFRTGEPDGGVTLLACCSATLNDVHYPGLMEELTSPEGATEGGNAFVTAAGSYLDAVVEGLLGVEILAPGCARLRVAPNVPASWQDWRARVPLPNGSLALQTVSGRLHITVTDPRVKVIEVPAGATVDGAQAAALSPVVWPSLADSRPPAVEALPAPRARSAAVLATDLVPGSVPEGLPSSRVSAEDLLDLDPTVVGGVIVVGNALPRRTAGGDDVPTALARYLDRGGALVFYGATMHDRGTMGEQGGVIEWYEQRPIVQYSPIDGWDFRRSFDSARIAPEDERGMREGWWNDVPGTQAADTAWAPTTLPSPWEAALGYDYDGWGWFRARFALPVAARGRVVVLDLGRIDDRDWTFVNGQLVGTADDWQVIRHYRIVPGTAAYAGLHFGGDNLVAVQVLDTGGGGGLFIDPPRFGVESAEIAWTPIDPRSGADADRPLRLGVVSWGPGGAFFNSWETSRGAFGFKIAGHGVAFTGPLAGLASLDVDVAEAFTDFAVSRPWRFEPLAFTETHRGLLVPDRGERYPCAARLLDTTSGGGIYLIPASIARTPAGPELLRRLEIGAQR